MVMLHVVVPLLFMARLVAVAKHCLCCAIRQAHGQDSPNEPESPIGSSAVQIDIS